MAATQLDGRALPARTLRRPLPLLWKPSANRREIARITRILRFRFAATTVCCSLESAYRMAFLSRESTRAWRGNIKQWRMQRGGMPMPALAKKVRDLLLTYTPANFWVGNLAANFAEEGVDFPPGRTA